jgi:hypothetical protein
MPIIASRASAAHGAGFSRVTVPPYAGPFGAYDALASVTVPSGGVASVNFAAIPTGYKHLQIRCIARTDHATVGQDYLYALNGDTTNSNYAYHRTGGDGASAFSQSATSSRIVGINTGASAGASMFGANIIDILDYASTNKYKTVRNLIGSDRNGTGIAGMYSNLWMSNSAVTSVSLIPENGNWVQNSTFALYGVK